MVKRENINECVSRWNRSCGSIWSKFGVQFPLTTISPLVKGDCRVCSTTGFIRHGAVVCRIVNWKGLNAFSVTSPLNMWTKFGVCLLGHLVVQHQKDKIVSYLLSVLLSGPRKGEASVEL